MARNLRTVARKLQQAIAIRHNRRIAINQYQSYSAKAGRTVTKYIITEYVARDGERGKYTTLFQSWSLPEIVKYLAALLQGDIPDDRSAGNRGDSSPGATARGDSVRGNAIRGDNIITIDNIRNREGAR